MLIAGSFSIVAGVAYLMLSAGDNPKLRLLVLYTATGGVEFVVQAWLEREPDRHAGRRARGDGRVKGTALRRSGRPVVDSGCGLGQAMRLHCAEVSSRAPTPRSPPEPGDLSDAGTGRRLPDAKALFIDVRVEGFFLERFNDRGEPVGTTQHETMDEAMCQASSEYELADWRSCPEDVDPVAYIRAHSDGDSHMTTRDG